MPREWWPSLELIDAVLSSDGPWPSPSPQFNGTFLPLDVDVYGGLAITVGYGPNRDGRDVLGVDEFQETPSGQWRHLGGTGSGTSLDARQHLQDALAALHLRVSGASGKFLFEPERKPFSYAVFLSGPEVATVEVLRQFGTRTASVSAGPGWISVLSMPGDLAVVNAYTADKDLTFTWTSPEEGPA
jgi:hypothetical protein